MVAYRKLPNLQLLLCKNDQNSLVNSPGNFYSNTGYLPSKCSCLVCKASKFGKYVRSPALPGYSFKIPEKMHCKSGPHVIYYLTCCSSRPECSKAHYVGRASIGDPSKFPMPHRWSVHKSHAKHGHLKCQMSIHLHRFHRQENPQQFVKIQLLQTAKTEEEAIELELQWQRRLFSFQPTGLNVREEILSSNL